MKNKWLRRALSQRPRSTAEHGLAQPIFITQYTFTLSLCIFGCLRSCCPFPSACVPGLLRSFPTGIRLTPTKWRQRVPEVVSFLTLQNVANIHRQQTFYRDFSPTRIFTERHASSSPSSFSFCGLRDTTMKTISTYTL